MQHRAWGALGLVARPLLGGMTRMFFCSEHIREEAHPPLQVKYISQEEAHIFSLHLSVTASPSPPGQQPNFHFVV